MRYAPDYFLRKGKDSIMEKDKNFTLVEKILVLSMIFALGLICKGFNKTAVKAATFTVKEGWYVIESAQNPDYVWDVYGEGTQDGANLTIYPFHCGANQYVYIKPRNDGTYTFMFLHSEKYVHISYEDINVEVHQWTGDNHPNSWFDIIDCGNGYVRIVNRATGGVIDNCQGTVSPGNDVISWWQNDGINQLWKIVPWEQKAYIRYYVVTAKSGLNLRSGAGTGYSRIMAIPKGSEVRFIEDAGNGFFKVSYKGNTGFCSSDYLSFSREEINYGSTDNGSNNNSAMMEFLNNAPGSAAVEWGGGSGTQCVELPKYYIDKIFGCDSHYLGLGNGNDLYSGIARQYPDKFTAIKYYDGFMPQVGDVISLVGSSKYGHAAIVTKSDGNGRYWIIEQWKGSGTISTRELTVTGSSSSKNGIIGVARPK